MILTKKLKPIEVENLIRIGRENDGGYVIPQSVFELCDGLLSYGINKDWTFEKDFLKKNPKAIIHCYDHTLNLFSLFLFTLKLFFLSFIYALLLDKKRCSDALKGLVVIPDYFTFFKTPQIHFKNRIWDSNILESKTIQDSITQIILSKAKKIFIKMDIEAAEYRVLNSIFETDKKIVGMAIEFHQLDKYSDEFNKFIDRVLNTYFIVHIHGNNYSKLLQENDFPSVLEITFMNKYFLKGPIKPSKKTYPVEGLDQPNRHSRPDCKLIF